MRNNIGWRLFFFVQQRRMNSHVLYVFLSSNCGILYTKIDISKLNLLIGNLLETRQYLIRIII